MQRSTRNTLAGLVGIVLCGLTFHLGAQDSPRVKVPDKKAQDYADKLINDIFQEDFEKAKDAAAKSKLASYLVQQGDETDDPAAKFVLYRRGRDLAADAGDATAALTAIEKLAKRFEVAALEMKAQTLLTVSKSLPDKEAGKALVDLVLGLINDAVDADNYDAAIELGKVAQAAARKAQSINLVTSIDKRNDEILAIKKSFSRLQKYVDRLKTYPKDPEANLELGKYYALLKGKWDRALPLLALGNDKGLQAQSKADLAKPKDGKDQLDLADGWWSLATNEKDPAKTHLLQRAAYWYEQALLNLAGLNRTKAQKRIDKIQELTQGTVVVKAGPVGEIKTFIGHTAEVKGVALSPDNRYGLSGGVDDSVRLWDLTTGKEMKVFKGHTKQVWSVAFLPENKIISGSWDATARIWDRIKGDQLKAINHPLDVNGVAISKDGKYLLTGCDDQTMRLWDLDKMQVIQRYQGHTGFVYAVAFSGCGRYVVSGSQDKTVRTYDRKTGNQIARMDQQNAVSNVAFSPDGKYAFSCGDDAAHMWDAATGKEVKKFNAPNMGTVSGMAVSPDGRRLLTASDDKLVRLWDVASGKEITTFKGHTAAVICVAFSTDGHRAISGSLDNTVKLWGLPPR
jgi:WD40 repeat protein